jgi:hypothetical protein
MKLKFKDSYKKLKQCVSRTGVPGQWRDLGNQRQFCTPDGASLNWWESSGTVLFQGGEPAARRLERLFVKAFLNNSLVGDGRRMNDKITDLNGVISEVAKLTRRQKRMRIEIAELKETVARI